MSETTQQAVLAVASGAMPHKFVTRIERELGTLIDMTEALDRLKAIKSAEEIVAIRKANRLFLGISSQSG